jgi:hypothetical protein
MCHFIITPIHRLACYLLTCWSRAVIALLPGRFTPSPRRSGTPEPHIVEPLRWRVLAVVGRAHVPRSAEPAAATQHAILARLRPRWVLLPPRGIRPIPIRHPLPDVARHIQGPDPARPLREAPAGCRLPIPVTIPSSETKPHPPAPSP